MYALEGSIAVTGSAVQWLRDQLGIISGAAQSRRSRARWRTTAGSTSSRRSPGLFAPYWRSDARGAIVGLSRFNTNAHVARATLEAICYQSRDVVEAMEADSGVHLEVLKVDGGITANDAVHADPGGRPRRRRGQSPVVAETTALGAAYAAGLAVGFWKDTDELRKNWLEDKRWQPAWSRRTARDRPRPVEQGRPAHAGLGRRQLMAPTTAIRLRQRLQHGRSGSAMEAFPLSPVNREAALADMAARPLDILIIGGGVVGAGAALDAATRGLRVGLVEARDFASGTSSRSSKLIHGGLRYLEMLDFGLVAEALHERGLLLQKLAPHLVRPVTFLYPLKHRGWERLVCRRRARALRRDAGAPGTARGMPQHRHLTRRGALRAAPSLSKDALVGAVQYYDAQVDDARHTMTIARTAAAYGARSPTRTRVVDLIREGERVTGARVVDLETGREFDVRARQVVNATGVWTDDTQGLANERGQFHVRASKGIHLVVPRDRIRSSSGLILRTEKSVLFVIPWGRHWIIGTTDTDWSLDKAHPAASQKDIAICSTRSTGAAGSAHRGRRRGRLRRPAAVAGRRAPSDVALSREHAVAHTVSRAWWWSRAASTRPTG